MTLPYLFMQGHSDWVRKVRVSPDGVLIASVSNDQVYLSPSMLFFSCFACNLHTDCVLVCPSGLSFLFSFQTVRIWNFASGECKSEFREHSHAVEYATWAPASATPFINEMVTGEVNSTTMSGPRFGNCVHSLFAGDCNAAHDVPHWWSDWPILGHLLS